MEIVCEISFHLTIFDYSLRLPTPLPAYAVNPKCQNEQHQNQSHRDADGCPVFLLRWVPRILICMGNNLILCKHLNASEHSGKKNHDGEAG